MNVMRFTNNESNYSSNDEIIRISNEFQLKNRFLRVLRRKMLISCDLDEFVYRGEGNSSLVIALKNHKKVIRLLKADAKQLKDIKSEEIYSILRSHIVFNEKTISRLISPQLFSSPKLIKLSENQIKKINSLVLDKRPSFRLDKSISKCEFALLLPDYCCLSRASNLCYGPTIAVEIKGFLPKQELLSDWLKVKSRVCRYCLSQFHKLKKGSIGSRSDYCPLDLFSGCPSRQLYALNALIDCPQNNFRVFRDIQYCFGEDLNQNQIQEVLQDFIQSDNKRDVFTKLLLKALNIKLDQNIQTLESQQQLCDLHNTQGHRCQCLTQDHELNNGCVLSEILCAQRLDDIDSELANQMLDSICLLANNNEDIARQLKAIPKYFLMKEKAREETQREYYLRKIWQFLVSLTAKDCSIMISMQRLRDHVIHDNTRDHVISIEEQKFLVSVSVTDLDEKCLKKIEKTLSNDKRMVKAYNYCSSQ